MFSAEKNDPFSELKKFYIIFLWKNCILFPLLSNYIEWISPCRSWELISCVVYFAASIWSEHRNASILNICICGKMYAILCLAAIYIEWHCPSRCSKRRDVYSVVSDRRTAPVAVKWLWTMRKTTERKIHCRRRGIQKNTSRIWCLFAARRTHKLTLNHTNNAPAVWRNQLIKSIALSALSSEMSYIGTIIH